jgi:predicted HicB family RNase H-like nuclease
MTETKPKMGRPPKPKAERKAETLTIRLTAIERKAAAQAAKREGVALAEWARLAVVARLSS